MSDGAFATLDGAVVYALALSLPRFGVWTAEVLCDMQAVPSGALQLLVGGKAYVGTFRRAGVVRDALVGRLVGGAANLIAQLPAKAYQGATVKLVLGDTLTGCGERLSGDADPEAMARTLPRWARTAGPAFAALETIRQKVGADYAWRTKADGTIWMGRDAWAEVPAFEYLAVDDTPSQGLQVIGYDPEDGLPPLDPGSTLGGRRISSVLHEVSAATIRARVWYES